MVNRLKDFNLKAQRKMEETKFKSVDIHGNLVNLIEFFLEYKDGKYNKEQMVEALNVYRNANQELLDIIQDSTIDIYLEIQKELELIKNEN